MSESIVALGWYKKLLKQVRLVQPQTKQNQLFSQIRQGFQKFKNQQNLFSREQWIAKAEEQFKFLAMITPRAPSSSTSSPTIDDGVVKYIKIDGEWVDMKMVDPTRLQRKDVAYMKGGSEDRTAAPSCPPGGCGRCQF